MHNICKKSLIKIYFAQAWGFTSKQLLAEYKQQSPNNSSIWNNYIIGTDNIDDADILIIQDNCDIKELQRFEKSRRYYFSREALDRRSYHIYKKLGIVDCSFWNNDNSYLWTKWVYNRKSTGPSPGINKTYDELVLIEPPIKKKKVCCILSNKASCAGHILRKKFMQFLSTKYKIDIYGNVEFANCVLENNDKFKCLMQYEYCMAFDNQDDIAKFFGTQFTDSILCYTIPIYWGGSNSRLKTYFPEKSFETINIRNVKSINKVIQILDNSNYEERLDALKEARNNILNKYNMWPTIEMEIKKHIIN